MEASSSNKCDGLAKAVAQGSVDTQAPETGALPGMLRSLPPKCLHVLGEESREGG